MRRVLVTGGSGFLGRALVSRLLEDPDVSEVTVTDLAAYPGRDVRSVVGDLRDPEVVGESVTEGLDEVVHLAALTSVLESANRPEDTFRSNVEVTQALLEATRLLGVPKFVFASTNAVVGEGGGAELDERSPLAPLTPYGATKAAAEMLLSAYATSYGIAASALRFTNLYGPGMAHKDSVVARLMKAAVSGGSVEIYGDGSQRRDFLYVSDACAAIERACSEELSGTFTVGSGSSVSVVHLHKIVCDVTGVEIPAVGVPSRPGEMKVVAVDSARMRSHGWAPRVPLEAGLGSTWEYFSSRASARPAGAKGA